MYFKCEKGFWTPDDKMLSTYRWHLIFCKSRGIRYYRSPSRMSRVEWSLAVEDCASLFLLQLAFIRNSKSISRSGLDSEMNCANKMHKTMHIVQIAHVARCTTQRMVTRVTRHVPNVEVSHIRAADVETQTSHKANFFLSHFHQNHKSIKAQHNK